MVYRKISAQDQHEAVVLATTLGLTAASEQLGIDERTVDRWVRRAGKAPADAIAPPSWERIAKVALAKAETLVVGGKLSAAQLLNVAGMAGKYVEAKEPDRTPNLTRYADAVNALVGDDDLALIALIESMGLGPAPEFPPEPRDITPAELDYHVKEAERFLATFDADAFLVEREAKRREFPPHVLDLLARADAYLETNP